MSYPPATTTVLSDHVDCDVLLATANDLRLARHALRADLTSQESGIVCEALEAAAESLFNAVNTASAYLGDRPARVAIATKGAA